MPTPFLGRSQGKCGVSLCVETHEGDWASIAQQTRVKPPDILSSFPQEGRKENSEKFVSKNFLGYSFFHSGFTADYEVSGKTFKIFIVEGKDQDGCRGMIENYLKQTGYQGEAAEGLYRLKDPYHGELDLFWKGRFIWGILGLDDPGLRSKYLKEVGDRVSHALHGELREQPSGSDHLLSRCR